MESLVVENRYEEFLSRKAVANKIPLSGTFELTPLCNMNCKMCYIRLSKKEMDKQGHMKNAKEWLEIAREAAGQGMLFVLLTGGEPLLHPEFKEIYLCLKAMGMYITINTNGTLIDEGMAEFFALHAPRRMNITLYGTSNETYDRLCHNPKGYDQTIRAIQLLKERNVSVKLNATFTQSNIQDLKNILDIADTYQLPVEIPFYVFPQNRKEEGEVVESYRLSPEQAANLRFEIFAHSFSYNRERMYQDIKKTLEHIDNDEMLRKEKPNGFWCKYLNICGVCAASMQAETGSFEKTPVYRCELMKEYERILREYIREFENENE